MSGLPQSEGEVRLPASLIDISRAYFDAKTYPSKQVSVPPPPEDPNCGKELRGRVDVHTRRAAERHGECPVAVEDTAFITGESSACVFRSPAKDLVCSAHCDDSTVVDQRHVWIC